MILRERERSRIRVEEMDNLRGLLCISRMNKIPNARIRDLCGVAKGVNEMIDGLAILKEWRMIGLIKRSMMESVWVVV